MKFEKNNKNERDNFVKKCSKYKKIHKPQGKVWKKKHQVLSLQKQVLSQMDGFLHKCCLQQFRIYTEASINSIMNSKKQMFKKPFQEQILQILRISKLNALVNKAKNKIFNDLLIIDRKMVTIQMQNRFNSGGISIQVFKTESFERNSAIAMFNTAKIYKATFFQLNCTGQNFIYCLLQMEKSILVILLTDNGFKENDSIWSQKKFYDIYNGDDILIGTQIIENMVYICGKCYIMVIQLKASVQNENLTIFCDKKAYFSLGKHEAIKLTKTQKGLVVTTKDFYLYYVQGDKIFKKLRTGITIQNLYYVGCHKLNKYFLVKDKDKIKFVIIGFSSQVYCKSYEIDNWNGQIVQSTYLNQQAYIVIKKKIEFTQANLYIFKFQPKNQIISLFEIHSSSCHSAYRIINFLFKKLINQKHVKPIF